ncbi:MAG: U32 family peptidase, partial [Firmicutes bacterium]|nr:U32 family peptidase [Bacillota bacterium]
MNDDGDKEGKQKMIFRPELVVPAGDPERLYMAVHYGADAVYVGGVGLNLRAYVPGFSVKELEDCVQIAHRAGVKVYVALNIFAHNHHLEEAVSCIERMASLRVDALIISDPGILQIAQRIAPQVPVHLSTQAGVTNRESARFWQERGCRRLILARELSLKEIREIRKKVDAELEVFVHGAMCLAYSGRCVLSSYFTGRGANRGECTQPCRWNYILMEENRPDDPLLIAEEGGGSYILSSRDLNMIEHIPELIDAGIHAFKIEGRMKGVHYVATVTRTYREAIDQYLNRSEGYTPDPDWKEELSKVSHRPYHTGFFFGCPEQVDPTSKERYLQRCTLAAVVHGYDRKRGMALVEQRNHFARGEELEAFGPHGKPHRFKV